MKKASPKTKQVPVRAIDELILYWPEHLIAHALLGSILNSHIFKIFEFHILEPLTLSLFQIRQIVNF